MQRGCCGISLVIDNNDVGVAYDCNEGIAS